jgi:anti-sigma factor ChrR (cupin superfamily)
MMSNKPEHESTHPSQEELRLYCNQQLSHGEEAWIDAHLAQCPSCLQEIEMLEARRYEVLMEELYGPDAETRMQDALRSARDTFEKRTGRRLSP